MAQISKLVRKKIGDVLVEEGILKEDQVAESAKRQRGTGETFGEAVAALGFMSEVDLARVIAKQFGLPYLDATRYRVNRDGLAGVSPEFMWQNQFIILDKIGKTLLVAMAGIPNVEIFDKLEKLTGSHIFVYVSTPALVLQALTQHAPVAEKKSGTAVRAAPGKK